VLDLVLIRHGQSTWNAENLFTGWVDVDLTPAGEAEARAGGELLAATGDLDLRVLHTSVLTRAIRTAELALAAAGRSWLPVRRDWRLNERHYGDLQGKNKSEIKQQYGAGQLQLWRRSYDTPPPPLSPDNPYDVAGDPRYRGLDPADLPRTECLADVVRRVVPYWESVVVPDLRGAAAESGGAVLIAAHGNSIRALRKHLERIADDAITGLEIPTGIPYRMRLKDDLTVDSADYLGDPEAAAAAAAAVARQADQPLG
jgi:2,3-bisphosphoglycerate-dependent phosphoglycerate mutase